MGDVIRVPVQIGGSGQTEATAIRQILHGTVAIDLPSINAGAVQSASGSAPGVVAGMNVLVIPQAWVLNESVIIAAALGIADGIQVTGTNPSAGAINPTSQTFAYWAWR